MSSSIRDKMLLVLVALLVCALGVSFGLFILFHNLNPIWFFIGCNSVGIAALFIRDFKSHLRNPSFAIYLAVWAVVHGTLMVFLMRRLPLGLVLLLIAIELTAGYCLADLLFNMRPDDTTHSV